MFRLDRGITTAFAVLVILLASSSADAGSQLPFNAKAFQAEQMAGNAILLEFHADWCPTCKAQQPILDKLSGEPSFSKIARFRVDFDAQKDVVKRFKARMQSTLVLYKGKVEIARSVGDTEEATIRAMLGKAL